VSNTFGIRNDDAEAVTIGSLLLAQRMVDDVVATGLLPEHFFQPKWEAVYRTILSMHEQGRAISTITVADEMGKAGEHMPDGVATLHEAVQKVATPGSADYYAIIVRDHYLLRRLDTTGARLQQMAEQDGEGGTEDVIARAESMIGELVAEAAGSLASTTDPISEALASLEHVPYVHTPWCELNDAIGGWMPSWHYVIGARPSVGKTAIAGNIIKDAARRGWRTVMFSQEMPRTEVYLRLMADMGEVHLSRILHRSTRGDDDANLHAAADQLRRLPIYIDDRSALSLAQMRAVVKAQQRYGQPVLVINDYLQITRPSNSREDRRVQVDGMAQQSKNAARDLKVPWISLAQLNRAIEGRATPIPTMSDLREAGGIEQSADTILLLHRDTQEGEGVDTTDMRVIIGKNRHGPTSAFSLNFTGEYCRVTDRARAMW
jgi:replicative DNA helicase